MASLGCIETMNPIVASSHSELLEALSKVPNDVPPRGIGRRTEHTEPWVLRRLIASLVSAEILQFPLSVELADRPDIVVDSAGHRIGIELMELIPPAYAQAVAIANRDFPSAIVDRSMFGWGATWTRADIRKHLRCEGYRLSGDGWAGNAVEQEWAEAVRGAIEKKTERLNSPGFGVFSENWLGTYASSPGPVFDVEVGATLMAASDLQRPKFKLNFDCAANLVSNSVVVVWKSEVTTCPHVRP